MCIKTDKDKDEVQSSNDEPEQINEAIYLRLVQNSTNAAILFGWVQVLLSLPVVARLMQYCINHEILQEDISFVHWALGEGKFALTWSLAVTLSTMFIIRPILQHWVKFSQIPETKTSEIYCRMDKALKFLYVSFHFSLFYTVYCFDFKSPYVRFAMGMELLRYVMKIHSFVIETITNPKEYGNTTAWQLLFFLVAPFLTFGRKFEKQKSIRWRMVLFYSLQYIFVLYSLMCSVRFFPHYLKLNQIGKEPFLKEDLPWMFVVTLVTGAYIYEIIVGYNLFSIWHSLFAEILRIKDRDFQEDFWNTVSAAEYLTKWNPRTNEWLAFYFYKPLKKILMNSSLAKILTLIISNIGHEYLFVLTAQTFFPVFSFQYLCVLVDLVTTSTILPNHRRWRFFFTTSSFFVTSAFTGIQLVAGCLEYYSRINCPATESYPWYSILPHTRNCLEIR